MSVEQHVLERYSEGAESRQESLCCPVDYDRGLLEMLPAEIIEKDYGCGDPSRYVRCGDTVLDLGSGGGKICYMAAQLVGGSGRVIGVDMNDDMLGLARKYQPEMAERMGGDRVEFRKGYIQDLALDLSAAEDRLAQEPIRDAAGLRHFQAWQTEQRINRPLIEDASVDLVISNCVLNLVAEDDRRKMIDEIFRVLKPGGRIAIADIIADQHVPEDLKADPHLWTGCISGAFEEREILEAFAAAGFIGLSFDKWQCEPWQVVDGIEFRSVTVTATKPSGDACMDTGQAAIYLGPYAQVTDDEGHIFPRGVRMAVCERTAEFIAKGPFKEDFVVVDPALGQEARPFCAPPGTERPARETRGGKFSGHATAEKCC